MNKNDKELLELAVEKANNDDIAGIIELMERMSSKADLLRSAKMAVAQICDGMEKDDIITTIHNEMHRCHKVGMALTTVLFSGSFTVFGAEFLLPSTECCMANWPYVQKRLKKGLPIWTVLSEEEYEYVKYFRIF